MLPDTQIEFRSLKLVPFSYELVLFLYFFTKQVAQEALMYFSLSCEELLLITTTYNNFFFIGSQASSQTGGANM